MREIFAKKVWERKVIVFFGALLLLIVLGPFGTYEALGFWERVVYWTLIMSGVGFFMHLIVTVALNTAFLGAANQFLRIAVGTALAGLPGAVVVLFIDQLYREFPVQPDQLPWLWVQVSVIGFVICLVEFVNWRGGAQTPAAPVRTRFHDRLNVDLGQVISLSMQDHYVEVTCEHGQDLILMRLSDAMAELDGLEGVQIHRSHWVAAHAIAGIEKSGQKIAVTLSDGRSLPVSATYADKVAEVSPGR